MSLLGIDLGNATSVVSVLRDNRVDFLHYETPAVVSFTDKQRLIGAAAAAITNPRNTISQINRLIGRRFDDPELQTDLATLPFTVTADQNNFMLIHVQYLNEERTFTPTEILAMILSDLKRMVAKSLGETVLDCCIGVPAYYTLSQHGAVIDAARIAGLHLRGVFRETIAMALGYRVLHWSSDSTNANVAIVDIGHASMQVSVVNFRSGTVTMLGYGYDQSLGGRDFDEVLFKYFAAKFKKVYKIDVGENARASLRLRVACEKVKKTLSANLEASLNIECLMAEKDVRGFIKREQFEDISGEILGRVKLPLITALLDAGLGVEGIHVVEIVGLGSQVPAIVRILREFFGKEPRRTVHASQYVARGCARYCTKLSPCFVVKDLEVGAPPTKKMKETKAPVAKHVYGRMTLADVIRAVTAEIEMSRQDKVMQDAKDMKNSLEALLYDIRNKLRGKYHDFITAEERTLVSSKLQQVEDWLYEDGEDETEELYLAMLTELKKFFNAFEGRDEEFRDRETAIKKLFVCIQRFRNMVDSLDNRVKYTTKEEKEKVLFVCLNTERWLLTMIELQKPLPKNVNPVLHVADVRIRTENLYNFCRFAIFKKRQIQSSGPQCQLTGDAKSLKIPPEPRQD